MSTVEDALYEEVLTQCCNLCGEDYYVSSGECVSCPAGTTNAAGDDASGDDTPCDAVACANGVTDFSNADNPTCVCESGFEGGGDWTGTEFPACSNIDDCDTEYTTCVN